jgi:hypothetical protein
MISLDTTAQFMDVKERKVIWMILNQIRMENMKKGTQLIVDVYLSNGELAQFDLMPLLWKQVNVGLNPTFPTNGTVV